MQGKWITMAAATAVAGTVAVLSAVSSHAAGPTMSSAWLAINITQDECVRRGSMTMRDQSFTSRFEVLGNASIYGVRGDYTALVRCAADKGFAFFVVAGPNGATCNKHLDAIRDNF